MLVLTRKCQEKVVVVGTDGMAPMLTVTVLEINGQSVRLGFVAKASVPVYRSEVWERIREGPPGGAPPPAEIEMSP